MMTKWQSCPDISSLCYTKKFNILVDVQSAEQTLFNSLILGKSRFPPKKFYDIDIRSNFEPTIEVVPHNEYVGH